MSEIKSYPPNKPIKIKVSKTNMTFGATELCKSPELSSTLSIQHKDSVGETFFLEEERLFFRRVRRSHIKIEKSRIPFPSSILA